MGTFRNLLLLTFLGLAAVSAIAQDTSSASVQKCLNYEPETVSLTGTIARRTFINVSEQKEVVWILKIVKPICLKGDEGSDFNVKRSRVSDIQLVLDPEMFGKYRGLLGKKVSATGTLFGEHTAHHFTPVLLDVSEINLGR
jgi:hypothetical protein